MATLEQQKTTQQKAGSDMDAIEIRSNPLPRYYTLLFTGLVLWAVLFSGWFLFSGWSSHEEFAARMQMHEKKVEAQPAGAAGVQSPEGMRAIGDKLYAENCVACHGEKGAGGIGPALNAATYQYGKEISAVQTSIAGGRPGGMPAFGNQLSPEQIQALVHYVTHL